MTRPKRAQADFLTEVFPKELAEIRRRRSRLAMDPLDEHAGGPSAGLGLVGLALSGGGIRSATFGLGVIQGLARRGILRSVDYVSTVSGGGYIGSCLSSLLNDPALGKPYEPGRFPLRKDPGAPETPALTHLRNSSNYLSPGGLLDKLRMPTLIVRGILLNLLLFLPYVMIAVYLTKLAFYFHLFSDEPAFGAFLVLGALFLLGAGLFPFVSRLFRTRFHWGFRNRYELWLTAALGFALASAALVPVILAVDRFLLRPWADVGPESLSREGWVLVPIVLLSLLIVGTASKTVSGLGSKLVLYFAGLLGPVALFALYLILCLWLVDTPYLTMDLLEDLEHAATSETNLALLGRTSRLPGELERKLQLEKDSKLEYERIPVEKDSDAKKSEEEGEEISDAKKSEEEKWKVTLPATTDGVDPREWTIQKLPERDRLEIEELGLDLFDEPHEPVFPLVLVLVWLLNRLFLDVNITSPHGFYRDRLSKAYLIRHDARAAGSGSWNDDLKLSELNREGTAAPYHLINAALNLTGSSHPNLRGRNADLFVFSKCFTGSERTGYCRTSDLEAVDGHLNLGTAMAISAAAAAPNMGTTTIKPLVFVMTLLNIRMGYWLPNPDRMPASRWRGHAGPGYLLRESVGLLDEKRRYVNVSDGGHVENLGVYELLRRRCKLLVAVDAEEDASLSFGSLIRLMRYAKIDMGITIEIDLDPIRNGEAPSAVGELRYEDGEVGKLLYVKASVTGGENPYILEYATKHTEFPHQSTVDQFFDETQFEAYRALGEHIAAGLPSDSLQPGRR